MIQKLLLIHPDVADTMQNHNPHDQKTDPQNDPKLLLIHPVGVDTMQNHNPHDQKTDPQMIQK